MYKTRSVVCDRIEAIAGDAAILAEAEPELYAELVKTVGPGDMPDMEPGGSPTPADEPNPRRLSGPVTEPERDALVGPDHEARRSRRRLEGRNSSRRPSIFTRRHARRFVRRDAARASSERRVPDDELRRCNDQKSLRPLISAPSSLFSHRIQSDSDLLSLIIII